IDRHAAHIHAHLAGIDGFELFFFAREVVVDAKHERLDGFPGILFGNFSKRLCGILHIVISTNGRNLDAPAGFTDPGFLPAVEMTSVLANVYSKHGVIEMLYISRIVYYFRDNFSGEDS
ncbi:MAG TPA: hypothetical protein DDW45_01135, partial [Gammaproteobacteria bacterium]|nr:hypothetical protein [Gammaproteobacteria bacterium]